MDNLEDISKVSAINLAAFVLSFSEFEALLRVGGLLAAFIYTCMKIVQLFNNWKK